MPFEDDEADLKQSPPARPGVKLSNQNSVVQPPPNTKKNFEERAKNINEKSQEFNAKAFEVGKAFMDLLSDKTLVQNKSPLVQGMEKEIIDNMITLGVEMNNHESIENEGMGSMGIVYLALRAIVQFRNRINQLEYRNQLMEKQLIDMADSLTKIGRVDPTTIQSK